MKTISLKVDASVDEKLAALARRQGASKSEVIREAIDAFLQESAGSRAKSCLELAKDLAGSVEGPSDLSSNAAHLEGFGE